LYRREREREGEREERRKYERMNGDGCMEGGKLHCGENTGRKAADQSAAGRETASPPLFPSVVIIITTPI
jgi:hypothetical protein